MGNHTQENNQEEEKSIKEKRKDIRLPIRP